MKIEFDETQQGYQKAVLFKRLLELARHEGLIDPQHLDIVADIHRDLEHYLAQEKFQVYRADEVLSQSFEEIGTTGLLARLVSAGKAVLGPGRMEQALSQQRKNLVERAERAEAMAYDALAETADVGRQRDQALARIKELEELLAAGGIDMPA